MKEQTPETFWDKVLIPELDTCWTWKRTINQDGYGRVKYKGVLWSAHRLAWYFSYGTIPQGVCVCHKCDNPKCCNPSHLFLGTHLQNMHDRSVKGRTVGHVMPGTKHPKHKLTEEQVIFIYNAVGTQTSIASSLGVSQTLVYRIKKGKAWKHLTKDLNKA